MTEFNVNKAPMFIIFGFEEADTFPVLQTTPGGKHKNRRLNKIKLLVMNLEINKTSSMSCSGKNKTKYVVFETRLTEFLPQIIMNSRFQAPPANKHEKQESRRNPFNYEYEINMGFY